MSVLECFNCMSKRLEYRSLAVFIAAISLAFCPGRLHAQSGSFNPDEVAGYRFVERTVRVKEPVTVSKWVEETQFETRTETEYRHVTQTEQRERRTVVRKPVTRTVMREERVTTRKPVTETRFQEREVEETSFDFVTEMREEQVVVQRPVIETQFRDEQVTVRQRVTQDLIEVSNQTVFRPQTVNQTVLSPMQVPVVTTSPHRLQWLPPGNTVDPMTGQSVFRRRGLHWVQTPTISTQTALMPTTVQTNTLVPETIQTRRPVEISRFEDRIETRRVPVEVQRMVTETSTRQVPVTVKRPVVRRSVERVPVTETRFVDVEEVRRVPVEETVFEDVVEIEPFEETVSRWVPVTREVEVPRTVRRRVEYEEEREVEKRIWVRIPVDRNGNALSVGEPVTEEEMRRSLPHSVGFGSTTRSESRSEPRFESTFRTRPLDEDRPRSILVMETEPPTASNPGTEMQPLRPDVDRDFEGEDRDTPSAADRAPTLNENGSDENDRSSLQRMNDLEKTTVRRSTMLDETPQPAERPDSREDRRKEVLATEK